MSFNYWLYGQPQEYTSGVATIYEYQRGLLYRKGIFERVLEAGRYRIWPWSHQRIVVVDVRRASAQVSNQKLMTADQITVTLNIVADYEIVDVVTAKHRVADYTTQLYEDVQLAARNIVGSVTVDVLLEKRVEINAQILEVVRPFTVSYGIDVLNVGIKDVILAPKVRDLLMKETEARRVAQAMLIGAREEVATLRALSNAARMAAEHPHLLRLRELDTVRAFAQTPGNTVVMGVDNVLPLRSNGNAQNGASTRNDQPEADDNAE